MLPLACACSQGASLLTCHFAAEQLVATFRVELGGRLPLRTARKFKVDGETCNAGGLVAAQARRQDAGRVAHQQVAGAQPGGEGADRVVLERPRGAVQHQQPRGVALGGGVLGDALGGRP